MPENLLFLRYQCTDDTALAVQSMGLETCEEILNEDLDMLLNYCKMCKLKRNQSKRESMMLEQQID
ncbi:Hypothetical protein CINCED_3A014140 [Cinara cedri]|uniref:Uncharacterized protein n=1 Tax=Cinara cedri TaxID=506608 RepID=A0A5E4MEB8_9HEMI|nr:Hypothetical protein CINCED_3A014140 [Cinara cedri]